MRRAISALLMIGIFFVLPGESLAKAHRTKRPAHAVTSAAVKSAQRSAAIVMDAASGSVLYQQDIDKPLHPASLTKVMTLLLLFDALDAGDVRLGDRLEVSQHAARQAPSKLGLEAGETIRVEDAMLSVVTKSANDMAVAIAENLAGSEARFCLRMTRRAHEIGMNRTNFVNASGLPDPQQISTARDMATLARYILLKYPQYYKYFGTRQFTYRGVTMTNHNHLMQSYAGMDGFKTGFVNESGFNLVASAKRNGVRMIGVVFGGVSTKARNDRMASLLDQGFASVRYAKALPGIANPVPVIALAGEKDPAPPAKPVLAQTPPPKPQPAEIAAASRAGVQKTYSLNVPAPGAVFTTAPAVALPAAAGQIAANAARPTASRNDSSEPGEQGDYDAADLGRTAPAPSRSDDDNQNAGTRNSQQLALAATPPPAPAVANSFAGKEQHILRLPASVATRPALAPPAPDANWSVQIGAYNSRVATEDALREARKKLPADLANATAQVVPLKAGDGVLFRARFGNLSQDQALAACKYINDCLPLGPR